jgi:hypothetical protein
MCRVRVGAECYAPNGALRRGYVHQVIHNNFHSAPEGGPMRPQAVEIG